MRSGVSQDSKAGAENTESVPSPNEYSYRPFAVTLGDLVREIQQDPVSNPVGRVNLTEFFRSVDGFEFSTLRKMITGERSLRADALTAIAASCSKQLGREIKPSYFREYRVLEVQTIFEKHPELVDEVYEDLVRWYEESEGKEPPPAESRRPYRWKNA